MGESAEPVPFRFPLQAPPRRLEQLHRVPRGLLGSQNVGVFEIRRLPTVKEVTWLRERLRMKKDAIRRATFSVLRAPRKIDLASLDEA